MSRTTVRSLQERKYSSGNQTIVAGGLLVLAHGLLVSPSFVNPYLVCQTAELGYVAGDKTPALVDTANSRGHSITIDSVNISIRFGSTSKSYPIINKTTGAGNQITNANWRLLVEAFA